MYFQLNVSKTIFLCICLISVRNEKTLVQVLPKKNSFKGQEKETKLFFQSPNFFSFFSFFYFDGSSIFFSLFLNPVEEFNFNPRHSFEVLYFQPRNKLGPGLDAIKEELPRKAENGVIRLA